MSLPYVGGEFCVFKLARSLLLSVGPNQKTPISIQSMVINTETHYSIFFFSKYLAINKCPQKTNTFSWRSKCIWAKSLSWLSLLWSCTDNTQYFLSRDLFTCALSNDVSGLTIVLEIVEVENKNVFEKCLGMKTFPNAMLNALNVHIWGIFLGAEVLKLRQWRGHFRIVNRE